MKTNEITVDSMTGMWSNRGEYTTDHLGVINNKYQGSRWYTWDTNGGFRGAFDRMTNGGWVEKPIEIKEISLEEATEWFIRNTVLNIDEAIEEMADNDGLRSKADIVREIGKQLWSDKSSVYTRDDGVYTVSGTIYIVDGNNADLVDREEAIDHVDDHEEDEDTFEEFKNLVV